MFDNFCLELSSAFVYIFNQRNILPLTSRNLTAELAQHFTAYIRKPLIGTLPADAAFPLIAQKRLKNTNYAVKTHVSYLFIPFNFFYTKQLYF
jgi:hypothetical protein